MRIKVKGFSGFKQVMENRSAVDIETEKTLSILECLMNLADRFGTGFRDLVLDPRTGKLRADFLILINGNHCRHEKDWESLPLKDGDEVILLPPVGGG
jgi:molybdopterin converting factor small subunit